MPSMLSESELLTEYARLHNFGIDKSDFSELIELFSSDAVLTFRGAVQMVFNGKHAIANAFITMPPTNKIYMREVVGRTKGTEVTYNSADNPNNKEGTIGITSQEGLIKSMIITID
jgi:hypothetical protein